MRSLSLIIVLSFFIVIAEEYIVSIPLTQSQRSIFKHNKPNFDYASPVINEIAELIVSEKQYKQLIREGYNVTIKARATEQRKPEDFLTNKETWKLIDSLSKAYPDLCYYDTVGYSQRYNKPIVCVKISDNVTVDEDEPGALFNGMVHAREPLGNAIIIHTIKWLLSNYNSSAKAAQYINNYQIYFVPIVNPDGWWYICDYYESSPWWRKNMRDNYVNGDVFSRDNDGVDLNRNFDWHWGGAGESSPSNWQYYGTEGNSESELKALDVAAARSRGLVGVSYHSYGPYVMYPYSYNGKKTPDNNLIVSMAYELTENIGNWYQSPKCLGGAGQGSDFLYGKYGIIDFTVETATNFIPEPIEINKEVSGNFNGICYLLDRCTYSGITGHITDKYSGEPIKAHVKIHGLYGDTTAPRMSDSTYGRFYRLLENGTYEISFHHENYFSDTLSNIKVTSDSLTYVAVELTPKYVSTVNNKISTKENLTINQKGSYLIINNVNEIRSLKLFNCRGRIILNREFNIQQQSLFVKLPQNLCAGSYIIKVEQVNKTQTKKLLLN